MSDVFLSALSEFLRFQSISAQSRYASDMTACASWLRGMLERIGLDAAILTTAGQPVVVGRSTHDPEKRTVLLYGHYDVQPPEPLEEWLSPPFEPVVRDERIWARGATDNKGQILSHILGVGELIKLGELPVNVIFLVEGEEEIGSPSLENFLISRRDEFACDVIAISDSGMAADFYPTLAYSLRGIAALEARVRGPHVDLHSGVYGGAIMNPAVAAAKLIASLHDDTGRVRIGGFYDRVQPMMDWERLAARDCPVKDAGILAQTGSPALFGEPGYSAVERIGSRPTAEVNGMGSGYQGEGTKTVLPRDAFFKLTFRLVPAQDPTEILDLAETHLRQHSPPGVTLEIVRGHSGEPYFMDPTSPDGEAAKRALEQIFGAKPALLREGGSIPILTTFKKVLGADSLLLALASPDCAAHSPNENYPIRNFIAGIKLNQALLHELAKVPRSVQHFRGDLPSSALEHASRLA